MKDEPDTLYDIACRVTDEVLGRGTYADMNRHNPDPGVKAAIAKSARLDLAKRLAEGDPIAIAMRDLLL